MRRPTEARARRVARQTRTGPARAPGSRPARSAGRRGGSLSDRAHPPPVAMLAGDRRPGRAKRGCCGRSMVRSSGFEAGSTAHMPARLLTCSPSHLLACRPCGRWPAGRLDPMRPRADSSGPTRPRADPLRKRLASRPRASWPHAPALPQRKPNAARHGAARMRPLVRAAVSAGNRQGGREDSGQGPGRRPPFQRQWSLQCGSGLSRPGVRTRRRPGGRRRSDTHPGQQPRSKGRARTPSEQRSRTVPRRCRGRW